MKIIIIICFIALFGSSVFADECDLLNKMREKKVIEKINKLLLSSGWAMSPDVKSKYENFRRFTSTGISTRCAQETLELKMSLVELRQAYLGSKNQDSYFFYKFPALIQSYLYGQINITRLLQIIDDN